METANQLAGLSGTLTYDGYGFAELPDGSIMRTAGLLDDFDIFEKFADGSTVWRGTALGQDQALSKMWALAGHSDNEFYAIDIQADKYLTPCGKSAPCGGQGCCKKFSQ